MVVTIVLLFIHYREMDIMNMSLNVRRTLSVALYAVLVLCASYTARGQVSSHAYIYSHAYCECIGKVQIYTSGCADFAYPVKIYQYQTPWQTSTRTKIAGEGWGDQSITLENLCPGTYYFETIYEVQVMDPNTGQPTGQKLERIIGQHTVVIEGPSQFLSVSLSGYSGAPCYGEGWIEATIVGGNGGNTITWKKDGLSFPEGTGKTRLENLANGTYTITVTDSKGCTKTATFTVSGQGNQINFDVVVTPSGCNGPNSGTVEVTNITGAVTPHCNISDAGATRVGTCKWINVKPGTWEVRVTDLETGCQRVVKVVVKEGTPVDFTAEVVKAGCSGPNTGSISLSITSGTPPYTYKWAHDPNLNSGTASNLPAGSYTVTVTDANGCSKTKTFTIAQVPPLDYSVQVRMFKENGVCKARICVVNLTGTAPYTYQWDCDGSTDGCVTKATFPATCKVTVTDANGCTKSQTVTAHDCSSIAYPGGGVVVMPNPNNGWFTAAVTLNHTSTVVLDVLDQNFNTILHEDKGTQPAGTNSYNVNITSAPSGMYFLLVTVDGVPPSEAILVQKW